MSMGNGVKGFGAYVAATAASFFSDKNLLDLIYYLIGFLAAIFSLINFASAIYINILQAKLTKLKIKQRLELGKRDRAERNDCV